MARVLYKHIYNYLIGNDLFYSEQSGFFKGHSIVSQLLHIHVYHQIVISLDAKMYTCMVFCDIFKAFDRV